MKRAYKVLFILLILTIFYTGSCFAGEYDFILEKDFLYRNDKSTELKKAYVEICLGSGDFTQYQDDEYIVVTPAPDNISVDEYGNSYARFNLTGLKPNAKFKVTLKRKYTAADYTELVPSRTNSESFEGDEIYLGPQYSGTLKSGDEYVEVIAPDEPEIISKVKEITEDMASDYKKAQAIFEFVNTNMAYDTSDKFANKGAISAFYNMRGVCEEFATLFVTMCRAVDIPSRCVGGFLVQKSISGDDNESGEQIISLGDHLWAEIYLQDFGWVPVDPTMTTSNGSTATANLDVFVKHLNSKYEYVADCLYNPEKPNRTIVGGATEVYDPPKVVLTPLDKVVPERQHKFDDLGGYDWAKPAVDFLYQIEVINGYSDEQFGPQNDISRIEFMSMLSRALRYKETEYEKRGNVYYYLDYDRSHWSKKDYDYLMRCYQNANYVAHDWPSVGYTTIRGIFEGSNLYMNKPITRAEVVALMDVFLKDDTSSSNLKDINMQKFQNSILKAYNAGLIVGYPDQTFRPNNNITRAEIAVILERYIGNSSYNLLATSK